MSVIFKKTNDKTYHPDIDGLRGVSIVLVLLFHAFPGVFKSGFIGVDIFFIISGFLISKIIFEELDQKRFSIIKFYIRRIKRIFPALCIVLIFVLFLGWLILFPEEYKRLNKHIFAASGFFYNFILINENSGYFDNPYIKPVLHLWSLSIEEQFYIFYPILILILFKLKRNLCFFFILFLIVLSFCANIYGLKNEKINIFYLPYTRFWELLIGSLLAYIYLYKKLLPTYVKKNLFFIIGIFFLIISVSIIDSEDNFPGWISLLPVISAVFLIASGFEQKDEIKFNLNKIILQNKILIWFGLISYPLYLFHWPLLSYYNILQIDWEIGINGHRISKIALIILSIFFSWLTYKFIEKRIRFNKNFSSLKASVLVIIMMIISLSSLYIYFKKGIFFNKKYENTSISDEAVGYDGHFIFFKYLSDKFYTCENKIISNESLKFADFTRCFQSKKGRSIDLVLIGDSHAESLFLGLAELIPEKNIAYYIKGGPSPFINNKEFKNIYNSILVDKNIKIVILNMWWDQYINKNLDNDLLDKEIKETINILIKNNKKVYIADDIPIFKFEPINCKIIRWPRSERTCDDPKQSTKTYTGYQIMLNQIVKENKKIELIKSRKYFCTENKCSMLINNKLYYRDNNHLNSEGSKYIANKIILDHPELIK